MLSFYYYHTIFEEIIIFLKWFCQNIKLAYDILIFLRFHFFFLVRYIVFLLLILPYIRIIKYIFYNCIVLWYQYSFGYVVVQLFSLSEYRFIFICIKFDHIVLLHCLSLILDQLFLNCDVNWHRCCVFAFLNNTRVHFSWGSL